MEDGYDLNSVLRILRIKDRLIDFIKKTPIYYIWVKLNFYTYKYIDDFVINVNREGKTEDRRRRKNYYFISGLVAFINYPLYRIFFEYSINALKPNLVERNKIYFNFIKNEIQKKSKYFAGFSGYLAAYMASLNSYKLDKYFNQQRGWYYWAFYHFVSLSLAYPFLLNSNYKILKSSNYVSIKNPFKYINLIFNKQMYLGYREFFITNILIFIPLVNMKAYKYEHFRICRIAAHTVEHGDLLLKEIEKNVIFNETYNKHNGKYFFNIYPLIYNVYLFAEIIILICFYDRASKYVNLKRKDDASRYREAMEKKYPRKPNEYYLNLWGPIIDILREEKDEELTIYDDED